jgi:hypothetical protein
MAQTMAKHSPSNELHVASTWLLGQLALATIDSWFFSSSCVRIVPSPKTLHFVCNWKG